MLRPLAVVASLLLLAGSAAHSAQPDAARLAHARELLRQSPLIDGHNDYPEAVREKGDHDLAKLDISKPSRR